jgi:hypothetical protein
MMKALYLEPFMVGMVIESKDTVVELEILRAVLFNSMKAK